RDNKSPESSGRLPSSPEGNALFGTPDSQELLPRHRPGAGRFPRASRPWLQCTGPIEEALVSLQPHHSRSGIRDQCSGDILDPFVENGRNRKKDKSKQNGDRNIPAGNLRKLIDSPGHPVEKSTGNPY